MYDEFDERDWTAGFRSRRTWVRGFFMLLFLFALWFARLLVTILSVFQFGAQLIAQRPVARLLPFGRSLGAWMRQIADFLTYNSEDKPFPFAPWPEPGETEADRLYAEYDEDEEAEVPYPPAGGPFPPEPEEEEPEETEEEPQPPAAEEGAEEETGGGEEAEPDETEEEEEGPGKTQPPRPDA